MILYENIKWGNGWAAFNRWAGSGGAGPSRAQHPGGLGYPNSGALGQAGEGRGAQRRSDCIQQAPEVCELRPGPGAPQTSRGEPQTRLPLSSDPPAGPLRAGPQVSLRARRSATRPGPRGAVWHGPRVIRAIRGRLFQGNSRGKCAPGRMWGLWARQSLEDTRRRREERETAGLVSFGAHPCQQSATSASYWKVRARGGE